VNKILAVDLDRTLIRQDSTLLCLRHLLRRNAFSTVKQAIKLSKIDFKNYLIENTDFAKLNWRYNKSIKEHVTSCYESGISIFLVTGAPEKIAVMIVKDLEFFAGYFCSGEEVILKYERKVELLIEKFGTRNFDYIGDSLGDRHVWRSADLCMAPKSRRHIKLLLRVLEPSIELILV